MTVRSLLTAAAALLLAGSAAAQPTPETPGAAGAEAAVRALVAAQRAQDWDAALRVLAPEAIAAMTADIPQLVADARTSLADSARIATPEDDGWRDYDRLVTARRVLAAASGPPREALTRLVTIDADLETSYTFGPDRDARPVGVQLEGDLAHAVVRTDEDNWKQSPLPVGLSTLRWAEGHWGVLSSDEAFWFTGRPDIRDLAHQLRRDARRPRPSAEDDASPASPRPEHARTPGATPGTCAPAGAEAAALALVAAQRAQDWPAAFRLLNPDAVEENAAATRFLARFYHGALADSVAYMASERYQREVGGDPYVFRMVRRLDAVIPPGDSLSDVEVMTRIVRAAGARNPSRLQDFPEAPSLYVVGLVVETDSLVHVVGRAAGAPSTETGIVSMRWNGGRWTMAHRRIDAPALDALDRMTLDWNEIIGEVISDEGDVSSSREPEPVVAPNEYEGDK